MTVDVNENKMMLVFLLLPMDQSIGPLANLLQQIKLVLTSEGQLVDVRSGDLGPGHLTGVAAHAAVSRIPRSAGAMARGIHGTLPWPRIQEGLVTSLGEPPH